MTYSTCSLNPIENEAVVNEIVRLCDGAVRLVNTHALLPQLRRGDGLSSWVVMDDSFQEYSCYEDVPEGRRKLIVPSVFPPSTPSSDCHLEWCMRLLPHHQNTGGFFVCLLEKVTDLPAHVTQNILSSLSSSSSSSSSSPSQPIAEIGASLVGSVKNEQEEFTRQIHKEMLIAWNHNE